MGWLEDGVEEFRKLPTGGKIAVGVAGVGVVALIIARAQSGGASASPAAPAATSGGSSLVPVLGSSTPADWSNWFSNGLNMPAVPDASALGVASVPALPDSGAPASPTLPVAPTIFGSIQNPTAASQLAHTGGAPAVSGSIQNPLAASQLAHSGVSTISFQGRPAAPATPPIPYTTAQVQRLRSAGY